MRNFKNYVVLSVALVIAMLVIMSQGVQASPQLIFGNNTTSNGTSVGDSTTTTVTPSASVTPTLTPTPVPTTTVSVSGLTTTKDSAPQNVVNVTNTTTPTNTVGKNGNLPQTGENDIYIVSAIGVVALIVGGVAYIKSRKYDI